MNVQCLSCSSRYSVPDAKVQGRKVRIKCKRCGEPILIDGTALGKAQVVPGNKPVQSSTAPPAARPAVEAPAVEKQASSHQGTPKRHVVSKKRTMIGMPSALESPAALGHPAATSQNRRIASVERQSQSQSKTLLGGVGDVVHEPQPARRAPQRTMLGGLQGPAASPQDPDLLWVVAVSEEDQRDLSTDQVVALYAAGAIDEETYVWKDGMDDWCSPFEAPELRRALHAARIAPRRPLDSEDSEDDESGFDEHDESVVPSSPLSADRSSGTHPGMWHEPGRVERDADPSFEDVTVSMNERQTEGLLEKARRTDLEEEALGAAAFRSGAPFGGPRASAAAGAGYPPVRESFEFDDEEVTRAISTTQARAPLNMPPPERPAPTFELSQRKGSSPPGGREESSVAFSLEALTKKSAVPSRPPPKQSINPFVEAQHGGNVAPRSAPPKPPLKPAAQAASAAPASAPPVAPPSYRPASAYEQAPVSYRPAPARQTVPRPTPMPPAEPAAPWDSSDDDLPVDFRRRKRARWPLALGILLCVAVAASYAAKQPLQPWAKLHELTQGRFPAWQELAPPTPPPTAEVRQRDLQRPSDPEPEQQEPSAAASEATAKPEATADEEAPRASKRTPKRAPERSDERQEKAGADSPPDETESTKEDPEQPSKASQEDAGSQELPAFDRGAAAEALGAAAASVGSCKAADGPTGIGRAIVTFANSGRATNANVSGAYAGTSVGSCITQLFQQARVPAFSGPPVKVAKSFNIE